VTKPHEELLTRLHEWKASPEMGDAEPGSPRPASLSIPRRWKGRFSAGPQHHLVFPAPAGVHSCASYWGFNPAHLPGVHSCPPKTCQATPRDATSPRPRRQHPAALVPASARTPLPSPTAASLLPLNNTDSQG